MDIKHKWSILLVDDEPLIRELLREILTRPGCEFTECASYYEGRDALENNFYDIVILDNHLPDGRGVELLPIAEGKSGRMIIISSDPNNPEILAAMQNYPIHAVMPKPFNMRILQSTVFGEVPQLPLFSQESTAYHRSLTSNSISHEANRQINETETSRLTLESNGQHI